LRYYHVDYEGAKNPTRTDFIKIKKGKEFIDLSAQTINFDSDDPKKGYKSVAFPVAHNGVVYGNTDVNLAACFFGRTLALRVKDGNDVMMEEGYDNWLRDNQKTFISTHIGRFLQYAREYSFREGLHMDANWENLVISLLPHIKKKLRMQAAKSLLETGKWLEDSWQIFMTRIKIKLHETAKYGKPPRGIGDLGVSQSLRGAEIMESVKAFMANTPFKFESSKCIFIKSVSHDSLKSVFDAMVPRCEKYRVDSYVFSDDSLVNVCFRDEDGKYIHRVYCIDISKCDMSHTRSLFELFRDMFESHGLIQILMDQCIGDVCMFGVDRAKKIILELLDYTLLSGSTLTTAINTLANYLIFVCICVYQPKTNIDLMKAVENCGYIVTTGEDVSEHVSQHEFLKHSPVLTVDGVHEPMIHLGPYFRRFGMSTVGDFPGPESMSIKDRAYAHEYAIINGMFGDGINFGVSNPFLDCLRRKFNIGGISVKHKKRLDAIVSEFTQYKVDTERWLIRVTDEELFRRYFVSSELNGDAITMLDVRDLYHEVENLKYGKNIVSVVLDEVLRKDYGLGRV